ncbi:MAG: TonB-dependent receptor [Gemmatimonadota bacterium]|nr:TonB-dependent receptor [Gemmatimonadota bacterium]
MTSFPKRAMCPPRLAIQRGGLWLAVCSSLTASVARAQKPAPPRDTLARDSVHRLETHVIIGTRLSTSDDRTGARVDRLSVRTVTPGPTAAIEALSSLPGVSLTDDQGSRFQPTLNLRGFTLSPVVGVSQGVSVFLDGVRINEPDAQELNFDLIPMDAVAEAQLVRGPATLFGKNSLAGALLLTTQRGGAEPGFEVEAEAGAFGFRGLTLSASGTGSIGAATGIDAYISAHASDETGWRDDTGGRTRVIFANIGWKRDSSDVALTVMYAHDRAFLAGSLPESWLAVDPRANYTGGDFFEPDLLHIALRGDRSFAPGTLRGNLFFRRNNTEQYNVNVDQPSTRSLTGNRSAGGTVEWNAPATFIHREVALTVGAEYSRNDVGYRTFVEDVSPGGTLPQSCVPATGICTHARVPEDDAAIYAQAVMSATQRLSLTAAARVDYVRIPFRDLLQPSNNGTSVFQRISPRVAARYQFDSATSGYASVSTAFRAPAALELACADEQAPCSLPSALGDDPPLAPVTVLAYEAGLDRELFGNARIGISAYRSGVTNEIVFVASSVTAGFFQNIAHTRRQGVELTGSAALPAGFRVAVSYAYLDATYQSTVALASALDENVAKPGDRFPLTPAHQGTFSLENNHATHDALFTTRFSIKAVSSQFLRGDDANREEPLASYAVANAGFSVQMAAFTVSAYVQNLLDRRYNSFGVFGENPLGPIGGPSPATPTEERFLTPGFPRAVTVSLGLRM